MISRGVIWWAAVAVVLIHLAAASFDIEKALSVTCERHCFNGVCLNGTCVCAPGWIGPQCDHCHGRVKLSENSSSLTDGPLNYASSSKCTWIIASEKHTGPLTLRLDNFATECGWDYVYIYDGDGVYGQQLGAFCGNLSSVEVQAKSGKAFVYFFSDLAMNMPGFNITYEFGSCAYNCSHHGKCTSSGCVCDDGWSGSTCDVQRCTPSDEGEPGPCLNGGRCKDNQCECNLHSHGALCESLTSSSVWDEVRVKGAAPAGRASHAAVIIDDVIWSIGGEQFSGTSNPGGVVAFNTTSSTWTTIAVEGTAPPNRFDHTLVKYKGHLFMFGGVVEGGNMSSELWSFDLVFRKWQLESPDNDNLNSAPLAVSGHSAHVVDNEMYVFFGYSDQLGFVYQVQIFDFVTQQWRFGGSKDHVHGRYRHASAVIPTEKGPAVLVYGGASLSTLQSSNLTDSLMQYDIKEEKWTNLRPSGHRVFLHSAVMLNGLFITTGGSGHNASDVSRTTDCFSRHVFAYDIACKQWYNLSSSIPELERYGHVSVATDNELFVWGGYNGQMLNDVLRFSPAVCSASSRPEECREMTDGVKCVFSERSCIKLDTASSVKQAFLSFVKNETPKGAAECPTRRDGQLLAGCEEQCDCVSCAARAGCGWCSSGEQCLPSDADCVDGQVMVTTWEKCASPRAAPSPRPCHMAISCHACKLLPHCNWFVVDNKYTCISLQEEAILLTEMQQREQERAPALRRLTPPVLPTGTNLTVCPLPCSAIDTCGQCIKNSRCMWCPSAERCINMEAYTLSFAYGQCHSWITDNAARNPKACQMESATCTDHPTCAECQLSPGCGWLDDGSGTGLGQCIRGTDSGPVEAPAGYAEEHWYFTGNPPCQCNGHSKCAPGTNQCEACLHNTTSKHCEKCAPGFFGESKNGGVCQPCKCNGQATTCDPDSGKCHCSTKGVSGHNCDKCDNKYVPVRGDPATGKPCFYELTVDFIFTFKLKNDASETSDRYATEIYLYSVPYKKDTDVTFQMSCEGSSHSTPYVEMHLTSQYFEGHSTTKPLMAKQPCDSKGLRRVYTASDPGYAFGTDSNTTFFLHVYNFNTPVTIQVSFAQSPPINWVLFFVIFAACFIVLLVVAGLLWMVKMRIEVYRRNQRRIDEIEHMASRPFSSIRIELPSAAAAATNLPVPISIEPCSSYKAGVYSVAVRLPTGRKDTTPHGTSGLAIASALCLLTPSQLAVLQAPESKEQGRGRKTTLRSYIPFLRSQSE